MSATAKNTPAGAAADDVDIRAVEAFLFHEADLIDARDYTAWLDLYTADCVYWLPLEESQKSGKDTVSLVYDDRKLLETRLRRLGHPRIHAQAPESRTVHVIGNVQVKGVEADGTVIVRSNQVVVEHRTNANRLFAGQATHHLVPAGGSYRIKLKRLDLVDSEGEHRGIPIIL